MTQVTARAPAKLILSGEHAVVYGAPALAAAINLFATTTVEKCENEGIHFHLPNIDYTKLVTVGKLRSMKNRIKSKLERFLDGQLHVKDILQAPFELAQFVFINTADYLKTTLSDISISTHSDIPVSCGLGSSAATSLSVMCALTKFLDSTMESAEYKELGEVAEKLQHGYPSGLDVQTILQGGCLSWHDGALAPQNNHLDVLYLINTGKPDASTGESVTQVKEQFETSEIWQEFKDVTNAMGQAIEKNDVVRTKEAVSKNHSLLSTIGVVPETVNQFITMLEDHDIAAKTCGAGSVKGESAGMVWAVAEDYSELPAIVEKFGYSIAQVNISKKGVHHD